MFVLTDFCDSAWREETTTRFSTTREQSASLSPARMTRPGAVGSSFLALHRGNAEAPAPSLFTHKPLWIPACGSLLLLQQKQGGFWTTKGATTD